jgi:hypothetical protein
MGSDRLYWDPVAGSEGSTWIRRAPALMCDFKPQNGERQQLLKLDGRVADEAHVGEDTDDC